MLPVAKSSYWKRSGLEEECLMISKDAYSGIHGQAVGLSSDEAGEEADGESTCGEHLSGCGWVFDVDDLKV